MKVVINTQHLENYDAHNGFDGSYRWKCKGGDTYVIDNVNPNDVINGAQLPGWEDLLTCIENSSDYFREYIIASDYVDDDAPEGEPWDTPYRLTYVDGVWVAKRTINNQSEFTGYLCREIASKTETYIMGTQGQRIGYRCSWTLTNGSTLFTEDALACALENMEVV